MLDDFLLTTLCTSGVLRRSVLHFIRFTWEDRARSGSITVCPSSATLASRKVKTIGRPRVPGHVVSLSLLTTGPVPPLGRAHPFPFVFPAGFPPHWTEHLPEKGLQCANAFVLSLLFFFTLNFSPRRARDFVASVFRKTDTAFARWMIFLLIENVPAFASSV